MKLQTNETTLVITNKAMGSQIWGIILIIAGLAIGIVLGMSTENRTYGIIAGLALMTFGSLALFLTKGSKITIDRSTGSITVWQKRLLGAARVDTLPTATITSVVLSVGYDNNTGSSDNDFRSDSTSRRSKLYLAKQDGGRIELGTGVSGSLIINGMAASGLLQDAPLSKEAKQIADFLELPISMQDFTAAASLSQLKDAFKGQQATPTQFQPPVNNGSAVSDRNPVTVVSPIASTQSQPPTTNQTQI